MRIPPVLLGAAFALPGLAGAGFAQSNVVPGLAVQLGRLGDLVSHGRVGTFPAGTNGFALETTVCNAGSVIIPWSAPMDAEHPFIAFLIVRESGGRLVQISDRSFVKHGYVSGNTSMCTPCQGFPWSNVLGVGCSDTYGWVSNGDNYWLGPPDEIDPWLGEWEPVCSHFDRGEPPAAPPEDCDGVRSLTTLQSGSLGPVGHRIHVDDADLLDPGAAYGYQGYYVVRGEAEALRDDNWGWKPFQPVWNAAADRWDMSSPYATNAGTVLGLWSGATLSSGAGAADGRVYVAATVTPTGCGTWHYELALHNRDHAAGVHAVRIPLAPGATVTGAGARDVDGDPANDWEATLEPGALVFGRAENPLVWNTIYNVWFDADAPPVTGSIRLAPRGASAPFAVMRLPVPAGAPFARYCTAGTSAAGCAPSICATGTPSASAGSGFVLSATGVEGGRAGAFFYGTSGRQAHPWGNGSSLLCVLPPVQRTVMLAGTGSPGSCSGVLSLDLGAHWAGQPTSNPGPGATLQAQLIYRDPESPANVSTGLSDAVEVVVTP